MSLYHDAGLNNLHQTTAALLHRIEAPLLQKNTIYTPERLAAQAKIGRM
jgi:hypothetical protein